MAKKIEFINQKKICKCIEDSFKSFMSKYFNKGPSLAKAYLLDDIVIIFCKDFLTTLEKNLAKNDAGEYYVYMLRRKLSEDLREELFKIVEIQSGYKVKDFYIDYRVSENSLCCVFILGI